MQGSGRMINPLPHITKTSRSKLYLANDILSIVHLVGALVVPIALLCGLGAGVLWCVRHVPAFISH